MKEVRGVFLEFRMEAELWSKFAYSRKHILISAPALAKAVWAARRVVGSLSRSCEDQRGVLESNLHA